MIYKNKIRINKCFPKAVSICISVSVSVYIGAGPQWAFYTESFEFSLGLGSSFHLLDLFLIVNCISFVTAQESMMVSDKTVKNAPTCQQLFSKIQFFPELIWKIRIYVFLYWDAVNKLIYYNEERNYYFLFFKIWLENGLKWNQVPETSWWTFSSS